MGKKQINVHRCRFVDWNPGYVSTLAVTPATFDASVLNAGDIEGQRGILAVGRSSGEVDLMLWGGRQGWILWRTLPSLWVGSSTSSALQHLVWVHQTRLSESGYQSVRDEHSANGLSGDEAAAAFLNNKLSHEPYNLRLFAVGGPSSELVEWHWCGPKAGQLKAIMPTLPPIFSMTASPNQNTLAIGCNDGSVRIVDVSEGRFDLRARIDLAETSVKKTLRVTSLAFGPPRRKSIKQRSRTQDGDGDGDGDEDEEVDTSVYVSPKDSYVVAGTSKTHLVKIEAPLNQDPDAERIPEKMHLFTWRPVSRLSVDKVQGQSTIVWSCVVLNNHVLVSGDSVGNVKFFDLTMGTQIDSFKAHRADVLSLTVGSTGESVYSTGVDQKTSQFRYVGTEAKASASVIPVASRKRWVMVSGRRLHWHDVKALVVTPAYTVEPVEEWPPLEQTRQLASEVYDQVPIMTSGGLDMSLVVIPVSEPRNRADKQVFQNPVSDVVSTEFDLTLHRRSSYVSQRNCLVSVSPKQRLICVARGQQIFIYQVKCEKDLKNIVDGADSSEIDSNDEDAMDIESDNDSTSGSKNTLQQPPWTKVLEMDLKLQSSIIMCTLSADGSWLVVSDLFETKLFHMTTAAKGQHHRQHRNGSNVSNAPTPVRIKQFSSLVSSALPLGTLGTGSCNAAFSHDSSMLALASSSADRITVFELSKNEAPREVKKSIPFVGTLAGMALSDSGRWLAFTTLDREMHVVDLGTEGDNTAYDDYRLPSLPQVPISLLFSPESESDAAVPNVCAVLPNNTVWLFDVQRRRVVDWGRKLTSTSANFIMHNCRESARGAVFYSAEKLIVYGPNWLATIDLSKIKANKAKEDTGSSEMADEGGSKSGSAGSSRKPGKRAHSATMETNDQMLERAKGSFKKGLFHHLPGISITNRYQPLVAWAFLNASEAVSIERSWFDLAKELPDPWVRTGAFGH